MSESLLAKGVAEIEVVNGIEFSVERDLNPYEKSVHSKFLQKFENSEKLEEKPQKNPLTSTPIEKSRRPNPDRTLSPVRPVPEPNIQEISNFRPTNTHNLSSEIVPERELPKGIFNPFDVNAAKWMDGSKVIRTNKPMPEDKFPPIIEKIQSNEKRKYIPILSVNIPCRKCISSDRLLHEVVSKYNDFDIYCFTELYIKDSTLQTPKGFKVLKHSISTHCAIVWFRERLDQKIKRVECEEKNFIKFTLKTGQAIEDSVEIWAGYRSPNYGPMFQALFCKKEKFEENFDKFLNLKKPALLIGDLNLKFTEKCSKFRQGERKFADKMKNSGFKDYIEGEATHKSTLNTATCTDVVLGSAEIDNVSIDINSPVSELDHFPITFEIRQFFNTKTYDYAIGRGKIYKEDEKGKETDQYKNLQKVGKYLVNDCEENYSRETAISTYKKILTAVDLIQPVKKSLIKTGKSRFGHSKEYYILKNQMDKIWRLKKKDCFKDAEYKALRTKCTALRKYEIKTRSEKDIGERVLKNRGNWAKLENLIPYEESIPAHICANKLALHFQTLSFNYCEQIMKNPIRNFESWIEKMKNRSNKFEFILPLEIGSKKKHLDIRYHLDSNSGSSHAVSIDGISREFLKMLPPEFAKFFDMMVTCSLATGEYMKDFRQMKGFAVFKKGKRDDVKNYRPILVCSQVAACCEKMAITQMQRWAESTKHYHKFQMGFREKFCIGSLVNRLKLDCMQRDKKLQQSVLINDLSNAFGSCDDMRITDELAEIFGVGPSRFWRSFVTQTWVQVEKNGTSSVKFATAPRGYPQGSVASPGSFLMLMRNLHQNKYGNETYSFADDTTHVGSGRNTQELEEKLQDWLNLFKNFCDRLNIKINASKSNLCHLKLGGPVIDKKEITIEVNEEKIEAITIFNLLGVLMNEKLNFKDHWQRISVRLKQKSGQIVRKNKNFSLNFSRDMISGYLHGTTGHCLDYLPLFDRNDSSKLNSKINSAVRSKFCTKKEKSDRVRMNKTKQYDLLGRADLISVDNQSRQARLLRLNKIARTGLPPEEFELLVECLETRRENRTNGGVPMLTSLPRHVKQFQQRITECQPYDAIRELNRLPFDVKKLFGTELFEPTIKKLFRSICQHSEKNEYFCQNCGVNTGTFRSPTVSTDNLRKMIIGGTQIKRWTKNRPLFKPDDIQPPKSDPNFLLRHLKTRSLLTTEKFLHFCREVNFWRTNAE